MKIEMTKEQFDKLNYAVSVALILSEQYRDVNPNWIQGAEAAREVIINEAHRTNLFSN